MHSKINYFLPKASTSPENFCISLRKVFINDKIKSNELKRKDIKTRALISIIDNLNLNEKPQWINNNIFYEHEKKIIQNINGNLNETELKNLYCELNDNVDATLIETFLEDNQKNEIIINSDEDNEIKSEKSDVEMKTNKKDNNKINIESYEESDSDKDDNLIEKEKSYVDNAKNYTLSVYNNLIENISNLDINNNRIEDNNSLSKHVAKARKRKTDEIEESSEKYRKKSKDFKRKKYPKYK